MNSWRRRLRWRLRLYRWWWANLIVRCPKTTLDGYRCRFNRFHRCPCEIGGSTFAPSSLEERNEMLRGWMQRGFEAELAEFHNPASGKS